MVAASTVVGVEGWLRRLYARIGLLVCLCVVSLALAVTVHHLSALPGPYTWFEPLSTLRALLGRPRFPLAVLFIYTIGRWARRGEWNPAGLGKRLATPVELGILRPLVLRVVTSIALLIFADALLLGSDRDLLDVMALTVLGFIVAGHRPPRAVLAKEVGYSLLSAAIFLVVCYAFTVSKALLFAGGRSCDGAIIGLEARVFGVVPHRVIASYAAGHSWLVELSDWVYFHFFEHMALVTVLLVALRQRARRTEYLGALALCYLVGGLTYHLFPAWGPSFAEPQYYLFLNRPDFVAGGIRRWLLYNTNGVARGTATELRTWGYIACMPSLHIAHELVMLYYSRGSRVAFALSFAFASATLLAVVVLGWHYPLDSLGGVLVALVAIVIARWQNRRLMPLGLSALVDEPRVPTQAVLRPFFQAYWAERRARAKES